MNKILVIGANGKIGRILCTKIAERGLACKAMLRDIHNTDFSPEVERVEADLEGDISHAMKDCDCVIFSAGSGAQTGFDKTLLIDLWGAKKAIDCAKDNNIKHFIMVSSRGADNPDNGPQRIKPYLVAKYFADDYLQKQQGSKLNYTILRPGRLTDSKACGLVRTDRPASQELQQISRADTADAIIHCLNNHKVHNKVFELFEGDRPISEALG
ncbi:SDR family oxidoreductase [Agaribacterium haliotis]|uniref:SDR family oxidoreductase n=1 Tax=Agaribacterium haliotis TaxID=2013869 RepID=UPI000BB58722|nr:SDR family oxidoreductase [Agaribacterium haliotis]